MDEADQKLEDRFTWAFYGDEPKCECCGQKDAQCKWRPAYQMMLCPNCPPKSLPRPT